MDGTLVDPINGGIVAGDPSAGLWKHGSDDYCFRLKGLSKPEHGAFAALAPYKPWWLDLKQSWGPASDELRKKFRMFTEDKFNKKAAGPVTHVAMNSGTLSVPLGPVEDEFIECYAKALLSGHRMYFVEQLSYAWSPPCFRLFMDLDFKQLVGITERGIEAASMVCANTVARFFPGRPSRCIVASTTYKTCSSVDQAGNKIALVKTGVHLYWPRHFVTPLQCLHIRESIIAALIEAFGQRIEPRQNSWADVVDRSVYGDAHGGKGSGLRMLGSCKTDKCPDCNGQGKDKATGAKCGRCEGHRRVDDLDNAGSRGRPYMMLCVLGEPTAGPGTPPTYTCARDKAAEEAYKADMLQLIKDTKLRTAITEATLDNGFDLPPGAPLYLAPAPGTRKRNAAVLAPSGAGAKAVEATSPLYLELQRLIRTAFGDRYAQVLVTKVREAKGRFSVSVTGVNCRYCHNIGREHRSNNIFFEATRDGVVQRCLDQGDLVPEMRHGLCKSYSSSTMPLDPQALVALFPSAHNKDALSAIHAPTAGSGDALFDEESDGARDNFEYQKLLAGIEYLGQRLHQESTLSVYGLYKDGRSNSTNFVPQDPRDLGTRGVEAYKDLGFKWAFQLDGEASVDMDEDDSDGPEPPSFQKLEADLMRTFLMYVTLASSAADPSAFDNCEQLHHIAGATGPESPDGPFGPEDDDAEGPFGPPEEAVPKRSSGTIFLDE